MYIKYSSRFERCKGTTFFETSKSFLKKKFRPPHSSPLRGLGGLKKPRNFLQGYLSLLFPTNLLV